MGVAGGGGQENPSGRWILLLRWPGTSHLKYFSLLGYLYHQNRVIPPNQDKMPQDHLQVMILRHLRVMLSFVGR